MEKKRRSENYKSFMNRGGPDAPGSKTIPDGAKNCLKDLAFVISGEKKEILHKSIYSIALSRCAGIIGT